MSEPMPVPGNLDPSAAVSYGWKKFQQYPGQLILIFVVVAVVNGVFSFVGQQAVDSLFGLLFFEVLAFIVGQLVSLGIIRAALDVTSGQAPDISRVFKTDHLGSYIVGSIVYGLAVVRRVDPVRAPGAGGARLPELLRLLHPRPRHAADGRAREQAPDSSRRTSEPCSSCSCSRSCLQSSARCCASSVCWSPSRSSGSCSPTRTAC